AFTFVNSSAIAVTVQVYTTYPQSGDSYARLGAPAGASIAADIAAIEAQTDDIGVAGAGLTAIPWNSAWDAQVQGRVADALAAYDPPTHAELTAATANLDVAVSTRLASSSYSAPLDAAGVRSAIGLASANLDTQLATVDTVVGAIKLKTDSLTFTVAGQVDANVQSINDVTITGNGQVGSEFGVA
ncbi:MAG TPA: hypothetical protein VF193_07580, partial [Steroidobacter sp.]